MADQTGASVIKELTNRIEEMKENLLSKQTILQELNKENQELRQKLSVSANIPDLTSQIDELKRNVKKGEAQIKQIDAENANLKIELSRFKDESQLETDPAELEGLKENLEQLYLENQQLKSKVDMLESDVQMRESLEQADKLSKLLGEKEDEIGRLHHAHSKLLNRLERLDKGGALPEDVNGGSAELEIEVEKLKLQIERLQESSVSETSQLENLRVNLELKDEALKQVSKENEELRERLAVVDSSDLKYLLEESHRKLQELSDEAVMKDEQLKKFKDIQNELYIARAKSVSQDEEITSLKTQIAALEDNSLSETSLIENLRQNLKLKQETVSRLNSDNEGLCAKVGQLEAEAEENEKRFDNLSKELSTKKQLIEKHKDVSSELEDSQRNLAIMKSEIADLKKQMEVMENHSLSDSSEIENLKQNLKLKQQTLQQLIEENEEMKSENEKMKVELNEREQQLVQVSEKLSSKESELEFVVRQQDQKFVEGMDKNDAKETELEELKRTVEQLIDERQQLANEVCIKGMQQEKLCLMNVG
mgnify:CR=1 FL=1